MAWKRSGVRFPSAPLLLIERGSAPKPGFVSSQWLYSLRSVQQLSIPPRVASCEEVSVAACFAPLLEAWRPHGKRYEGGAWG